MPTHEVKPLGKDEVVQLFRHYYPKLTDAELPLLHDILHAVGHNTLVTELLAKNLTVFNKYSVQYSLADLLADLQKKGLLALKNKAVKVKYGSDTLRTEAPNDIIAAMYDLAKLSDTERYLLSNLAVLPAENIAYSLLNALLGMAADNMDEALRPLEEKGWLEYRDADSSFKISPVVQEVTRKKNADRLLTDCRPLIGTLKKTLGDPDRTHKDKYSHAATCARLGGAVIHAIPTPDVHLSYLSQNIGNYHQDTGSLLQMMGAYQKMLDIQTALCETETDNPDFKNGLAISYQFLGNTHTALGNLPMALTFFEELSKLFKELHEAYPQEVDFKKGLSISYSKLGSTHTALGNLPMALTFNKRANQTIKELHEAYPQEMDFKNGLAISYEKLGQTHMTLGKLPQALTFFEEQSKLFKELHEAYPQEADFKNGLAISYEKLGQTHTALGNLPMALTFFEELSKLFKELHEAYPQKVPFKNGLAISYEKLGETHTALGNLELALSFFEKDIELSEALYAANPQYVDFKNGLAISYYKLGEFSRDQLQDRVKAKAYFQQAEALLLELVWDAPQVVEYQQFLGMVQKILADL